MAIPYLDKINCTIHYGCEGTTEKDINSSINPEDDRAKTIKLLGVSGDRKDRCYYYIGEDILKGTKVVVSNQIEYRSSEDNSLQHILLNYTEIEEKISQEQEALIAARGRIGVGHGNPPFLVEEPNFSDIRNSLNQRIESIETLTIGYEIYRKFLSRNDRSRRIDVSAGTRMKFDLIEYAPRNFVIVNLREA